MSLQHFLLPGYSSELLSIILMDYLLKSSPGTVFFCFDMSVFGLGPCLEQPGKSRRLQGFGLAQLLLAGNNRTTALSGFGSNF